MKIVICGSRRFHDGIRDLSEKLRKNGHIVLEPILNQNKDINNLPNDLKKYAFLGLTHHHFEFIRKSDICLMYNKDGYLGNSGTLELGFSVACGIPIYALSEDKEEACRNVLFDFVVKDTDEFINIINSLK
jgi:nucleoside 2-deoxyribosyltransferase